MNEITYLRNVALVTHQRIQNAKLLIDFLEKRVDINPGYSEDKALVNLALKKYCDQQFEYPFYQIILSYLGIAEINGRIHGLMLKDLERTEMYNLISE